MKTAVLDRKARGFTIIEVVLVLAIAGLIFLVVFLALPALQRSQRDTQRKQDLSKMMSQVTAFSANSQGALPASTVWNTTFKSGYLTSGSQAFNDPQLNATYTITQQSSKQPLSGLTAGNIWVYVGYVCDSADAAGVNNPAGTGTRTFAAVIFQEQGGAYCQSN